MILEPLGFDFAALSVKLNSDPPREKILFVMLKLPFELPGMTLRPTSRKFVPVSRTTTFRLLTPPAMLTVDTHPYAFPAQLTFCVAALAGAAPMTPAAITPAVTSEHGTNLRSKCKALLLDLIYGRRLLVTWDRPTRVPP
jgi:hypothetical protein